MVLSDIYPRISLQVSVEFIADEASGRIIEIIPEEISNQIVR